MICKSSVIGLCILVATSTAYADVQTQTFESFWTVEPWDYYGDISAMQWHYIPYETWNSTLGTLTSVTVDTSITGSKTNAADATFIRYSFFTGWSPADYQFYDGFVIPSGSTSISTERSYTFSGSALSNWLTYDYLPQANYYFESKTISAGHTISAKTTLTYEYTPAVPEPNSFILALAGAAVAATWAKRRASMSQASTKN